MGIFKRDWDKSINIETTIQYMLPGLKSEVLVTPTCYASQLALDSAAQPLEYHSPCVASVSAYPYGAHAKMSKEYKNKRKKLYKGNFQGIAGICQPT